MIGSCVQIIESDVVLQCPVRFNFQSDAFRLVLRPVRESIGKTERAEIIEDAKLRFHSTDWLVCASASHLVDSVSCPSHLKKL